VSLAEVMPASARGGFFALTVDRVDRLTDDSAAITFAVPEELRDRFAFRAGQSLTVRRVVEGTEQRRSYSICAPAGGPPRIGVREVRDGAVSGWLVHDVRAGDTVEVQAPSGTFTPQLSQPGHHVLIAAGSGVTPMLSIAATALADPRARVTLLYGNRRSDSVMFVDDLADLKDAHPSRLHLVHVLSRERQEVELYNGRLDAAKLRLLLPVTTDVASVDHWWLCGPFGLVTGARDVLLELAVPAERIHRELFYVEDVAPPVRSHHEAAVIGSEVTVVLDGRATTMTVPGDCAILDGAQRIRPDLPFACKGGVCGTCRARVTSGEVHMRRNYALEPAEVEAGFVLTCQSLPVTDQVTVDFDA
jgi:ring-1,2-phenylacetyl-CoA epoxidase subunit PaaE